MFFARICETCGESVRVSEGCYFYRMNKVKVGDHVSFHPMCYINGGGGLEIGSNVSIAHGTSILTLNHDYSQIIYIREAPVVPDAVKIGSDVWIGAGVRILPGVQIGDHVVIGASSVVTKSIESNTLCVGNPAKPIKTISSTLYISSEEKKGK